MTVPNRPLEVVSAVSVSEVLLTFRRREDVRQNLWLRWPNDYRKNVSDDCAIRRSFIVLLPDLVAFEHCLDRADEPSNVVRGWRDD